MPCSIWLHILATSDRVAEAEAAATQALDLYQAQGQSSRGPGMTRLPCPVCTNSREDLLMPVQRVSRSHSTRVTKSPSMSPSPVGRKAYRSRYPVKPTQASPYPPPSSSSIPLLSTPAIHLCTCQNLLTHVAESPKCLNPIKIATTDAVLLNSLPGTSLALPGHTTSKTHWNIPGDLLPCAETHSPDSRVQPLS